MNDEVDQNTVDKQCAEIERKNLLIANENLIANCLSNQLLYDVEKSRCLDLGTEMSKVQNEIKHVSKLEREYLNLQLKYQHLQESFDNNKSQTSQDVPEFNSFFKINNLENQIQEKDNVIRDLKVLVSNVNDRSCEPYNANDVTALIEQNECVRVELEEVKQHYKELFESIQITRASTNEKTSSLLTQIEDLKAQLEGNMKVAARSSVKTKVLALESVETVREIVEEARVVKPLDNALNYACQYTKLSQELIEYVIGTCPKEFTERDSKAPSIPLTRKKQVIPSTGVWKATSKLFANVGYQWRPTGKKFSSGKLNCGYQWRPTGKKFALGELCPLTRLPVTCGTDHPLVSGLRLFKTRFRGMNGSWLAPSPVPATTYIPPTDKDLEILFQPMFNEYFDQSTDGEPVPTATVVNAPIVSTNTSVHNDCSRCTFYKSFTVTSQVILSLYLSLAEPNQVNQPPDHLRKWTKDHPLDNIVGNPSRPVSTRKQLASDALWCCYHTVLSKVEPKNFKMAVNEDSWFKAMQDEIHEFDRLKVWELVPRPPSRRRG
ncbi:hypothetical protein Tco_0910289 [Tanacetum coccineum]|uniref:Uncharacterized protein n=1 Tax=Tanacetum coccineum TaxID=301880 RepID=A0ABQ5CYS9_9ASTR